MSASRIFTRAAFVHSRNRGVGIERAFHINLIAALDVEDMEKEVITWMPSFINSKRPAPCIVNQQLHDEEPHDREELIFELEL